MSALVASDSYKVFPRNMWMLFSDVPLERTSSFSQLRLPSSKFAHPLCKHAFYWWVRNKRWQAVRRCFVHLYFPSHQRVPLKMWDVVFWAGCVVALLSPLSLCHWMRWHAGKSAKATGQLLWFISSGLSDGPPGKEVCKVWRIKKGPQRLTDVNWTQPAKSRRLELWHSSVTAAHVNVWSKNRIEIYCYELKTG